MKQNTEKQILRKCKKIQNFLFVSAFLFDFSFIFAQYDRQRTRKSTFGNSINSIRRISQACYLFWWTQLPTHKNSCTNTVYFFHSSSNIIFILLLLCCLKVTLFEFYLRMWPLLNVPSWFSIPPDPRYRNTHISC